MLLSPCHKRFWVPYQLMTPLSCSLVLRSFVGLTLLMTPLSYSLVVRALVGPALVNDPLSSSFLVRAFVGPALVHDPPFSAFRRHSYTRFSNSLRNKTSVVFFPWLLPDWCTINT